MVDRLTGNGLFTLAWVAGIHERALSTMDYAMWNEGDGKAAQPQDAGGNLVAAGSGLGPYPPPA